MYRAYPRGERCVRDKVGDSALSLSLFWSLSLSAAFAAQATGPSAEAPESKSQPGSTLTGSASYNSSRGSRDFEIGLKALDARLYRPAQEHLSKALESFSKTRVEPGIRLVAHLALAEALLAGDNIEKARLHLEQVKSECQSGAGGDQPRARYFADLAELQLAQCANGSASEAAANKCIQILQKSPDKSFELALAHLLRGRALMQQAYFEEARDEFKKAIPVLEKEPGKNRLDYAAALAGLAAAEKKLEHESESVALMKTALGLKDDAVVLDKTADQRGLVRFDWLEGLYGSAQIVDPVYPLKYMVVNGVRVACTLVRSDKHLAVLISLANCCKNPIQLAVGPVSLVKVKPGRKTLDFCDPGLIDEALEEQVVLDRTWRRRILCHIQKSRLIPGYLKDGVLDPDDFFGNNQWGLYGAWDTHLRDTPPLVPRDQLFFDDRPRSADQEILLFMRGNAQVRPTYIETGAARTGVVFFLRERYEDVIVRVFIGNAELRFPFHVAPGQ